MSEGIRAAAEASIQRVYDAFADFPWEDPAAYADWIAQTYYYVRYVPTAMTRAAERCGAGGVLHEVLVTGAREEQGHDRLLLRDIQHLGRELSDFPESPEVTAYYRALFTAIENEGPAALFGFSLPLEGLAAQKMSDHLRRVRELYSDEGTHFLRVHCELDVEHYEDGLRMLSTLSAPELDLVRRSLRASTDLYLRMLGQLKARHGIGT
jgi:pyrroloquinoline quinone (PQQ) biosynthesis protein C